MRDPDDNEPRRPYGHQAPTPTLPNDLDIDADDTNTGQRRLARGLLANPRNDADDTTGSPTLRSLG